MRRKRRVLITISVLLLAAGMVCGILMRHATDGAADPDTQETTVAGVAATITGRLARLGSDATGASVKSAVTDQLPALGKRGFIRVHLIGGNIDVLAGTDYGLENLDLWSTATSWTYRMSLAPVETPGLTQPLYITAMTVSTGTHQIRIMVGSAGPTATQTRVSASFTIALWICVCLAVLFLISALLPAGNRSHRTDSSWIPVRRGLILALTGLLVAAPVAWSLMHQTRSAARAEFAKGADLVAATSASTLAGTSEHLSAAWLHAVHSMNSPGSSFRVLINNWPGSSAGTDYGPGSYVREGAAGEWRTLSPVAGGGARSVYVTAATSGKIRVEMTVQEPCFWQAVRLRRILLWTIPAVLIVLFALGYFLGRPLHPPVLSQEEILQHTVVRQTVLTVLVVCLALLPAAGWFVQTYEAASVGRLDQTLQRDAAQLQTTLDDLRPAEVATRGIESADLLETSQTGLIFSVKGNSVSLANINPQYPLLQPMTGASIPQERIVPNRTDYAVPPGENLRVRVMTVSGRLKDGTVYTALLGTTMYPVRQDMQELWRAAAWAGPIALLFIVLASLIAAILALRPVTSSMRRLEQFTGDAGHELRTPLSSIRLNAQVALAQDRRPEDFRRHLTAIASQAERSTRLAESLLLLARLDRREEVPMETVNLTDIWPDLSTAFAGRLAASELTLQTPSGELTVKADRGLLTIALDNLIDNAVRYSPPKGTIAITMQSAGGRAIIAVTDQGPGIPPTALPHIWDRFYRADASRSRDSGGNGLGLAIVHNAVEAMHGRVAVTSEVGRGSTFSIILPTGTTDVRSDTMIVTS